MARMKMTGKRFSVNGMLGITMIAVLVVAVASLVAAAVILPQYAEVTEHETPNVIAIVAPDNGLISIGADPSQVFVTVKYSDGSSQQVALSELVVTGLDTSSEGTLDGVVLDYGGFKQTVSFNVVPTELKVEYIAATGGRIDGETSQSVTAGADATRVEAIPDEGYYFAGWSDGDINASRMDKQISKSMRLIAKFEKLRYTVVFYYPDGTTAREEVVAYNEAPLRVPRPDEHNMEMYGYRFVGWDVDYTHITKDTNIYPLFEKYSADFNLECTIDREGNALGSSDALEYYQNDEVATVRVQPTYQDYLFMGWSVYDVDLQAWVAIDPPKRDTTDSEEGEKNVNKLVRVGVNHAIEFISSRIGTTNEYVLSFTPDENVDEINVKAHFVYKNSTITFVSNGNEARAPLTIGYQTPIGELFNVEDLSVLDMLGYSFKGWYVGDGEVKEDGSPVLVNNETKFTQPTELIAYWEKEIFTAVFLKGDNESTSFTDPSQGYVEDFGGQHGVNGRVVTAYYQDNLAGAITGAFPEEIPVKENYTFKGWYLADADRLPTSKVVDRTFKLETPVCYIVPVFEENTKTLTVSMSGSGSIYSLINLGNGVYQERSISSRIEMPVTKNYSIRIRPSEGYSLSSVTINGATTTGSNLAGTSGYYDVTIEAVIATDYEIKANFTLNDLNVSILNGTAVTNNGTITYGLLGTTSSASSTQENINAVVNYGSSLSVEINPLRESVGDEVNNSAKYYIASVSHNGVNLNVPTEAVYYNLVIENITENQNIVITYREFTYNVTVPQSVYGEMIAKAEDVVGYTRGDKCEFTIKAIDGYYIRRVTANGTIIDPYTSATGYSVDEIKINGKDYDGVSNDYRVTQMDLAIVSIEKDVTFNVEYAQLYYNVTTSYEGIGSVDAPFVTSYNSAFQVQAVTSSGYYVHSIEVTDNGEVIYQETYGDVQLAREYNVSGVARDYNIKFIFKRTTYFVRFEDANGYSSVTYNNQTINIVSGEGYTFTGVEHATTSDFVITAKEGYYINKITVTPNVGLGYEEDINHNEKSHVLTISDIRASYSIEINCLPITLDYNVYLINKKSNSVSINNEEIVGNSYSTTMSYGGEINVNINPDEGYGVALANVTINNMDARDNYSYLPLEGEYNKTEGNGWYSILSSFDDTIFEEVLTLFVYDVQTSIDVYIYFEEEDADVATNVLNFTTEGVGDLLVTDASGNSLTTGSAVLVNSVVKFALQPLEGSEVKALIINGKEVPLVDGTYELTVKEDINACAVFGKTRYTITIVEAEHGVIATRETMVEENESVEFKLTPVEGYYVSVCSITVEGSSIIHQFFLGNNEAGFKSDVLDGAFVTGNITITAQFAPCVYVLKYTHSANGTISGVGTTGDLEVFYGETKSIEINANDGFFIDEIRINNESISTKTLLGTPTANGEYVSGKLQINVSGDVTLDVVFSPMVYTITINESLGGTTLVKKDNSAYLPARDIKLSAGDNVSLKMQAEVGYHIASFEVPGREVDNWKEGNVSENDLNQIFYDLGEVTGNITVIVKYAVNQYSINVNTSNVSPNFSAIDVDTNTYCVALTVNGQNPSDDTTYTHGSNVKFVVTPRTARGYYIYKLELQYVDDNGQIRYDVINSINENGGSYIQVGISRNITVNVEFKRRAYAYSQNLRIESEGSPWLSNGSLSTTFKNPYSNAPVIAENGLYEYGLTYTVNAIPGEGYTHGLFELNGSDRLTSLRNNSYVGTINSDLDFNVVYTIQRFKVDMVANSGGHYAIYGMDDTLLWMPGVTVLDEEPEDWDEDSQGKWVLSKRETESGIIWVNVDGLEVTYGTEVVFSATPDNSIGFRIATFRVNGSNRTIRNEDATMTANQVVTNETTCEVLFTIHTYSIKVNTFVGGVAQLSTSTVEWNKSLTIRLIINRGYVMGSVLVNGEEKPGIASELASNGSYTTSVTSNWDIVITLLNKEYDIDFDGNFATKYDVIQKGEKTGSVSAVSGVVINENVFGKDMRSYYTSDEGAFSDGGTLLNRAVYADKLTFVLIAPNGYRITSVFITMENDGGVVSNLVINEGGLDADDGSGRRTYTIPSMTGNVKISVTYAIKQYVVEYVFSSGGQYDGSLETLVSHHELIEIRMISYNGFYLSNLDINGRSIATVYSKDEMRYQYTTTATISEKEKYLEVNDELVNGEDKITILPTYEKQRYEVIFFVNNQQITSLYQDETLGLSLENNELVYDAEVPSTINHTLKEGYSITSVAFYNAPKHLGGPYYSFALESSGGRTYNTFTAKGKTLSVMLERDILSMMDFHSASQNVIRIYYTTAIDQYDANTSMYLVQSEIQNERAVNKGAEISSGAVPLVGGKKAFTLTTSFSDRKDVVRHEYGTEATLTININASAAHMYSFQGFQEYKNGVWSYVKNDSNGDITLQSNGQVLRYTMKGTRTFRAVFFRVYEVTVQIHPEYKYYEGSFANNDPSRMKYRQYASLSATATYTQDAENGVILPNVVGTMETLSDSDGVVDATYTYRVLSGARLVLRGSDNVNINATKGYSYSVITYVGDKMVQREDGYNTGVETLEDRLVYAYFNNVMYASFAMETIGETVSSEGGTVTYARNGAMVGSLSNNSLTMSPNQTLTITIQPKANYRFDSIMELLPLSTPDAQGFRQFSSTYSPLTATSDGRITFKYTVLQLGDGGQTEEVERTNLDSNKIIRITRVEVTINNLAENSIFKIRFWKQIEVKSGVSFVDEKDLPFAPTIINDNNPDGLYDYNTELLYNVQLKLSDSIYSGFSKYYQFVGYFINGVNAYTQLVQNYPSTYEGRFVLNDLDGLPNGVNIEERTVVDSGVSSTYFSVEIVAKFIPVYNIVIENEYLDNGEYLNPGQITASAIMYDEGLTQYFTSSSNVEPKLGAGVSYNTDMSFQMLGKINTIDTSNKNSANSSYNTWNDNTITLNWVGGEAESESFSFIAWQYYAYDPQSGTFAWKNIPYVDPTSQTNLVTKGTFTFPVSCLFDTSYLAYVSSSGTLSASGFYYNASVYDYNGNYSSFKTISAIRIRPLFQKVENLTLIKSTALYDETIFIDGQGEAEPKINSNSRSNGYFNYYTVQTILPSAGLDYVFAGWYVTENGNGGYQRLNLQGTLSDHDKVVEQNGTIYYLKTEEILDTNGNGTGKFISYSVNPVTNQAYVLMDSSFKIFARYIRIYNISVRVSNLSGFSQILTDSMPTLNCYMLVDGAWVYQGELSGNRMITIDNARVGSKLKFTLSTNFSGNMNDSTRYNPMFDRFAGITAVNYDNLNVWDGNGSLDATESNIPKHNDLNNYILGGTIGDLTAYNNAITQMEVIVTANDDKTVNINFESFGTLVLHNVYVGSAIKLPNELGEVLYKANPNSVEIATDANGDDAYYVKDGGMGDSYNGGVVDGIIAINSIPILSSRSFDGQVSGDYATRLIENSNVLDSDNISLGVNFDGSSITKKVQNIVYYGQATWAEYEYVDDVLTAVEYTRTSLYDYPFADGGVVGSAGDGSEAKPFKIATIDHLRNIDNLYKGNNGTFVYGQQGSTILRVNFVQVADINLNEVNNALTSPLCSAFYASNGNYYSNGFNGVYDGANYSLYNLQFELRSSGIYENVGIFSKIYRGGVVKNVAIGRSTVNTSAVNVGILAGSVFGGTIENVYYTEKGAITISNSVIGSNFVGGLVGLLSGENEAEGIINNCAISSMTVSATIGGSYLGLGSDYTGGVGGIVGSIGNYGRVQGTKGGYTVNNVTVVSGSSLGANGVGAGGVVGTVQAFSSSSGHTAILNVIAIDTRLANENNKVAIGGIVGAVGANRVVNNAQYQVVSNDATITSNSATSGFTAPSAGVDGNYVNYGGGGIAGYNNGRIRSSKVTTSGDYRLSITGSMVGGLVGVNLGSVENSNVVARIYTSRQKGTSYEGGAYGGMIGFNVGTIKGGSIVGAKAVTNDYNQTTAAYEVVTNDIGVYVPVKGSNGLMDGDPGVDNTNIYVGGVVGYNIGGVDSVINNSKLMVNRRSNDEQTNISYVGAICGFSNNNEISASGTAYVKFFHYIWVDQATDVNQSMTAFIGNLKGNGTGSTARGTVHATAEYVGGGAIYNPASIEAGFTWGFEATGYLQGSASVYFYNMESASAWSYAPDWNVSGTIEAGRGQTNKVYWEDCKEVGGSIETLWKSTWNYEGKLRYIAVSPYSA